MDRDVPCPQQLQSTSGSGETSELPDRSQTGADTGFPTMEGSMQQKEVMVVNMSVPDS